MKKQLLIAIGLILIPFAYAIYLYPTLPAKIPMHFNMNGEVDGWGSRESIFVYFIMANIKKIDPKRYENADDKIYGQFGLFTVGFLTCLSMVILYSTVHRSIDMNKMIFPLLGFAFTGMGIYMPKLKQNYIAGFKLPWTLENEANWNATHALAGKVWTMGGTLQMISAFLLNGSAIFIAFISITGVMVIIPSVFSYRMFKRGNTTK